MEKFPWCRYGHKDSSVSCKYIHGREWKHYIDDDFSLWDCKRNEMDHFIEQANTFHPTIKFAAEILENEITFPDTVVFKGVRFIEKSILDIKTHYITLDRSKQI